LELASLFYILKYDKLWGLSRRVFTLLYQINLILI